MKIYSLIILAISFLFLVLTSCEGLKWEGNCDAVANFEVSPVACPEPCTVRVVNMSTGIYDRVHWTLGDGNTRETDQTFEHVYEEPGIYNINLNLTLIEGLCPPADTSMQVIVGESTPIPSFVTDTNWCVLGQDDCEIQFTNRSQRATHYEWYINEALVGESENLTYPFTRADTFTVRLRAFNNDSNPQDTSLQVIVRPLTFGIRTFDLDGNPQQGEAVWGVDEAPNDAGYYLIANNNKACYMATTNRLGELDMSSIIEKDLGTAYNQIQPNAFFKTDIGYVMVGRGIRPDFNQDIFVFRASNQFNFVGLKPFFELFQGANEDAFSGTLLNNGNLLISGKGTINGSPGVYLAEIKPSLSGLVASSSVLESDEGAKGMAMLSVAGGYYLTGTHRNAAGVEEAFLVQLDHELQVSSQPLGIGTKQFSPYKIILLADQSLVIIGMDGSIGKALRIAPNHTDPILWNETYPSWTIRDGILSSEGRLIVVGANNAQAAWLEIDLQTGKERPQHQLYDEDPNIHSACIQSIVETRDGGFLLGGKARLNGFDDHALLLRTDRNGVYDQ